MILRNTLLIAHRWVGLVIAGFLIMTGLTGAVISWDHELDDLLNRHLTTSPTEGTYQPALDLARRVEAADPRVRVTYVPLTPERGDSLTIGVEPRVDPATGQLYEPGYNEVFLDPVTGAEIGRREWGQPALTRENFVPFLYLLHYSLQIPEIGGNDRIGIWLMGVIALVWTLDCFVGFYLTLPRRSERTSRGAANRPGEMAVSDEDTALEISPTSDSWWRRWKPAWQVKWSASGRRINFDLHRAAGLWTWAFLFLLALSGMSMNLYTEVAQPLVTLVSDFTPSPYDVRPPRALDEPIEPRLSMGEILERARVEGQRRGWAEPVGAISYASLYGVFAASFFEPGGDHGAAGLGTPQLYFDSADGRYLGDYVPWKGTAGDLFLQLQFPLHSGRIAGIPGRIFISLMGIVVVVLSATGLVIWWQKRSASMLIASRRSGLATSRRSNPLPTPQ
jgi:uncharacterized iron-regulated membrane protein